MNQNGKSAAAFRPKVLLYNMKEDGRTGRIKAYLRENGLDMRIVAKEEYALLLGTLAGIPGFEELQVRGENRRGFELDFDDEMLVMCGLDRETMDRFLRFFREEGLKPVALKAALTPTNMNWTSCDLHAAIAKEHAMMQRAAQKNGNN